MQWSAGSRVAPVCRRTALVASAALGLSCGACAGEPESPPAPASTLGPVLPPNAGSGAAGTVLGPATDVPVGGGTVYPDLEVVVTQPTAGDYRGFSAVCTHTGCIINNVAAGAITCPCHGSRFRLDGSVAVGPAPSPLRSRPVQVDGGRIVLV